MPSQPEPTHYDHLMVSRTASLEVIRAAYRALTQKYHPDRNPDNAAATRLMQLINESYAVLCDPEKREEYDRRLAEEEARKLALALQTGRSLVPVLDPWQVVPVLHAAQDRARKRQRRSQITALALALSVLVIAALGVLRHSYPELAQRTLDPLSAAHGAIQRPASPEGRRELQTATIVRPAPAPEPASSASVSDSSDNSNSSESSASSTASQTPAELAKPATEPHVRAPKRAVQRVVQRPAPPPPAAAPLPTPVPVVDDLAEVRSKDPAAAEHISSYCGTVAKTAVDAEKGGAACRRNESLAWKHFVLTSNDAQIYEEVRVRCTPGVYPDSYEAKEACVRYESGSRARVE
jgi:curved DNA-binding protein CbpA